MTEELGLVCHAPLSVSARQQNANDASVLSMASLPLLRDDDAFYLFDRPLVDGAPCLREPGHDRPSGGRTPGLQGPRGLGGRGGAIRALTIAQPLKKNLFMCTPNHQIDKRVAKS